MLMNLFHQLKETGDLELVLIVSEFHLSRETGFFFFFSFYKMFSVNKNNV